MQFPFALYFWFIFGATPSSLQDAIERLEAEVYALKQENKYLEEKLNSQHERPEVQVHDGKRKSQSPSGGGADTSALLALTKKLQDASAAYEKVKKEMGLLKKVCLSGVVLRGGKLKPKQEGCEHFGTAVSFLRTFINSFSVSEQQSSVT